MVDGFGPSETQMVQHAISRCTSTSSMCRKYNFQRTTTRGSRSSNVTSLPSVSECRDRPQPNDVPCPNCEVPIRYHLSFALIVRRTFAPDSQGTRRHGKTQLLRSGHLHLAQMMTSSPFNRTQVRPTLLPTDVNVLALLGRPKPTNGGAPELSRSPPHTKADPPHLNERPSEPGPEVTRAKPQNPYLDPNGAAVSDPYSGSGQEDGEGDDGDERSGGRSPNNESPSPVPPDPLGRVGIWIKASPGDIIQASSQNAPERHAGKSFLYVRHARNAMPNVPCM